MAVAHGAEEDDVALAERASRRKAREAERRAAADVGADPDDRSLLGPSVHHLETTLVPAVQTAVEAIKNNKGHANQSSFDDLDPAEASIWHTVHSYAKPASAATVCPRDGEMDTSTPSPDWMTSGSPTRCRAVELQLGLPGRRGVGRTFRLDGAHRASPQADLHLDLLALPQPASARRRGCRDPGGPGQRVWRAGGGVRPHLTVRASTRALVVAFPTCPP